MNSIILVGDRDQSNIYISDFISSHAIKPYYIERFSETLKIAHVREMKKKLSLKIGESECRLFVIEGDITIEAQNALLKVFEESASWAFFIVCVSTAQDVLPTISSRCQLVFLEVSSKTEKIEVDFANLDQSSYAFLSPILEQFHFFATMEDIEAFIRSFRAYIVQSLESGESISPTLVSRFISICEYYPLVKTNNINKRNAVEILLIT